MQPFNPDNWPRDSHGRYVCDRSHPMPSSRDMVGQKWVHYGAREMRTNYNETIVWYRCEYCGQEWSTELPE